MLNQIDLSRLDLNLLVLFEAVFQERHVTRAAERLNLSPSAVSHGLGRLRKLLNDPLFIRTPKGVIPNERAVVLAPAVAEVLQAIRELIATSDAFDPATSTRRFKIGAPDGVSAVFLDALLSDLRTLAPGIDLSVRHLLPLPGEADPDRAWRETFATLESGAMDIAIAPIATAPARFAKRELYREDFVLVMRPGHPFLGRPTLDEYCAGSHLVVSESGDPAGFVDQVLAREGRARRIALTAPNFMFACAVIAKTELLCAVPRHFAARYAGQFGIAVAEPPLVLGHFNLTAFTPQAALADTGIDWLFSIIGSAAQREATG